MGRKCNLHSKKREVQDARMSRTEVIIVSVIAFLALICGIASCVAACGL